MYYLKGCLLFGLPGFDESVALFAGQFELIYAEFDQLKVHSFSLDKHAVGNWGTKYLELFHLTTAEL